MQYRVIVQEGVVGGQLVRASFGDQLWLVRVPEAAVVGNSFLFTITEHDTKAAAAAAKAAASAASSSGTADAVVDDRLIIEGTILEPTVLHQAFNNNRAALRGVLADPFRVLFVLTVFAAAFLFGLIVGTLFYTRDWCCLV